MTTKKLYKVKTKTVLYELYEVEAESYDKALDSVFEGQDDHHDDYPINVDRIGWWYDDREFVELDHEYPGIVAISISEKEAEKTMLGKTDWWIYKPDGCPLGDWREGTDEERVADEKQAVADGRLNEKFASYT